MTYPQSPPSQPPVYDPPPPQKKKGRVGLIIAIVVGSVVLVCGGIAITAAALGGKAINDAASSSTGAGTGGGAAHAVGLNQPGRDGKFEFTATKIECGIAQVGSKLLNQKAQGQFCEVSVTVKNIGDEARTFHSSNQFAFNATGQKYDADGTAGIYLEGDGNAFLKDINPGNSVNGTLVFDIPKGGKLVKLELHDSSLSGGVIVNLG